MPENQTPTETTAFYTPPFQVDTDIDLARNTLLRSVRYAKLLYYILWTKAFFYTYTLLLETN